MNPRTRKAALYAIGVIAILASANALAHSYAGLYAWAVHHRLTGWQAMSWPAEIDVFLAVGELALYVAYLDDWPARQRVWPWATALTGLTVSVAGNIGHIQAAPGNPVSLADRMTAATSPLAALAGLSVGLLVVKMTRHLRSRREREPVPRPALVLSASPVSTAAAGRGASGSSVVARPCTAYRDQAHNDGCPDADLLHEATAIYQHAAARGERLSQRALARHLRMRGHRFPNEHLRQIAETIGLTESKAA